MYVYMSMKKLIYVIEIRQAIEFIYITKKRHEICKKD